MEILYRDEEIVIVNKPAGLLVHRSKLAMDAQEFAVQKLRDQLNMHVFPVHRLDRKTSGLMMFCTNRNSLDDYYALFRDRGVRKTYHAITRGFMPEKGLIDYPLKRADGTMQEAISNYRRIDTFEIDVPSGKHPSSRYSLAELVPETGRMHQLRRHMAHILHPIIGDRPHGCNKQNRFWKNTWGLTEMLLHAISIEFKHPRTSESISIQTGYPERFEKAFDILEKHKVSGIDQ